MRCNFCGAEIPEGNTFCGKCGKSNQAVPTKKKSSVGKLVAVLISLVVIFFFVIPVIGATLKDMNRGNNSSTSYTTTAANIAPVATSKEDYLAQCESVDYETLARTPENYNGKCLVYNGEIVQIIYANTGSIATLRIAVSTTDDISYSNMILAEYDMSSSSERLLEGDLVTIYGNCEGAKSYETVLGAKVTLPYIYIRYVNMYEKPNPVKTDENGNQSVLFKGLEITFGSDISFSVLDSKYNKHNGSTIIEIPINITNKNEETTFFNRFYLKCFDSTGIEADYITTVYEDADAIFKELRSEASTFGHLYIP